MVAILKLQLHPLPFFILILFLRSQCDAAEFSGVLTCTVSSAAWLPMETQQW